MIEHVFAVICMTGLITCAAYAVFLVLVFAWIGWNLIQGFKDFPW